MARTAGTLAGAALLAAAWWGCQQAQVREIPILMYHGVGDDKESIWWVRKADFEKHLQFMRQAGYASILPSDLVAHRRWGKPLPRKPVIITFDDGYLNSLDNAEPLLKQYGFRGIVYLITGRVADSPAERMTYEGSPCLTWPEVRDIHRRGTLTFGGHTRNHANLAAIADPYEEIKGCYRDIKNKAGFRPDSFCYPNGEFRPSVFSLLKKARFTTAVTCHADLVRTGGTNAISFFELPRASVYGGTHVYHVERQTNSPAPGTISLKVWKEGVRVTSLPRLAFDGMSPGAGWLDPVRLSTDPVTLTWTIPAEQQKGRASFSLWGDLKVLPHWQEELAP